MTKERRLPRWAKVAIGVLAGVAIIFYVGGGFMFANMIHADALTPLPPTPDNGVYITAVDAESITLASTEHREDTVNDGVFGLLYDDGYGQIGTIRSVDGRSVTRDFEHVSGQLPQPCSDALETCKQVDIEGWTYETDPTDAGLSFVDIEYETGLGEMGAWQVQAGSGEVWAIHVHGWRAARREAVRSLPVFHEAGITSLVIDYRNDPHAPADPTGLYRFGRSEWHDVEAAVRYAIDRDAKAVVLVGYSTGASAHMAFLERSELADMVTAVVFDSPNIDMGGTVRFAAEKRTLPGTSIPVPSSLVFTAMAIADLRWDVGWDEIDYLDRAHEILDVPTLVFHGDGDTRVPIEASRRLGSGAAGHVELIEVTGAAHVASWNVDPAAYEAHLGRFLEEVTR